MRIALMPSAYAPAVGGVEVLTAHLAAELVAAGHSVEVWTGRSAEDDLPERETIDGIAVRRFVFTMPRASARAMLSWPRGAVGTMAGLRRAVRDFRPDVLNVQCFSNNGGYATAASRLTGVPLVVSLHGETLMDEYDIYDRSASLRFALRSGLRRARVVTGCSQFTLDDARRFGLDPRKERMIHNGLPAWPEAVCSAARPTEPYLLSVGRLSHKKGFDLLVAAMPALLTDYPGLRLLIAGDGPRRAPLAAQIDRLGLTGAVQLLGTRARDEVAALMAGAAAVVVPSRVEPFGLVVLEAWLAHAPVVVTSRGGPGEFVQDGLNGTLVDPLDPVTLTAAVGAVLSDPHAALLRAEAGRASATRFSLAATAAAYEAVLREAS